MGEADFSSLLASLGRGEVCKVVVSAGMVMFVGDTWHLPVGDCDDGGRVVRFGGATVNDCDVQDRLTNELETIGEMA